MQTFSSLSLYLLYLCPFISQAREIGKTVINAPTSFADSVRGLLDRMMINEIKFEIWLKSK